MSACGHENLPGEIFMSACGHDPFYWNQRRQPMKKIKYLLALAALLLCVPALAAETRG